MNGYDTPFPTEESEREVRRRGCRTLALVLGLLLLLVLAILARHLGWL